MELEKELKENLTATWENFSNKEEVLQRISELAIADPSLAGYHSKDIYWALMEREKLSSTGFGNGIAIPHCTLDCSQFVIGALTVPQGVEFESIDGQAVHIIVYIIAPEKQRDMHIRYLSALSGLLNDDLNRKKILAAKTPAALIGIFMRHIQMPEALSSAQGWNQINFIVQSEEIMDSIMGILTEIDDTHIAVIDANNAGYYLYSKPLFSSLWGAPVENYCKVILATVPRRLSNEVLRRTNHLITQKYSEGLIVTVHPLEYLAGKLNI